MIEKDNFVPTVENLIEAAPYALVRTDLPIILQPDLFARTQDLNELTTSRLIELADRINLSSKSGKLTALHVTAGQIMDIALKTPKGIDDKNGFWWLNTVDELFDLAAVQRFGRHAVHNRKWDNHDPVTDFHDRAREWREKTHREAGDYRLWEFGLVFRDARENFCFLCISTPWDGTRKAWYEHLTPEEIFIGREAELDMFSYFLTGRSLKENKLRGAFEADETALWWQQAQATNVILKGRYNEIAMRIRPPFDKRVVSALTQQISSRDLHDLVCCADFISGYFVTARPGSLSDTIELTLNLDTRNWLEPYNHSDKQSEIDRQRDYSREWIEADGYLRNDPLSSEPGSFGVYIGLADAVNLQSTSTRQVYRGDGVTHVVVHQHFRLANGFQATKDYFISDPGLGDRVKIYSGSGRVLTDKPINQADLYRAHQLFQACLKRGIVDSETLHFRHQSTGITDINRNRLANATALLNYKLEEAGIAPGS